MQNFIIESLKRLGWSVSGDEIYCSHAGKQYRYRFVNNTVHHDMRINGAWVENGAISVKDFHDKLRSECDE